MENAGLRVTHWKGVLSVTFFKEKFEIFKKIDKVFKFWENLKIDSSFF